MAKGSRKPNIIILLLTVVIAIGSIATITQVVQQQSVLSGIESTNVFLEDFELPTNADNDPVQQIIIQETPLEFEGSTQDQISQFLETIGLAQTETLGVEATIELIDANRESDIQSAFVKIQPLEPELVIVSPDEPIPPERLFIDTDFSVQLADNGINYHQFTGWDVIRAGNVGINVFIGGCEGIENHNGKCARVDGSRRDTTREHNTSTFYGIVKDINISDWTKEGELILRFDYGCSLVSGSEIFAVAQGDTTQKLPLTCSNFRSFEQDVSSVVGSSNILRVKIGGNAISVDNFKLLNFHTNNVQVEGNSVAIREAVELVQGLSLIGTDPFGQVLDLGFIKIGLVAETLNVNERLVFDGTLEARVNDQTFTTHKVTANGRTDMDGKLQLRIEGSEQFVFELNESDFKEGFNTLKFIITDVVANVGDSPNVRTFEYHRPFVVYILDFDVNPDEILAFDQENRAIAVKKNDSTFIACGITGTNGEPNILPPQVRIVDSGFTIANTNPEAGIAQATDRFTGEILSDTEFCSTVPNLPRDTELTFIIDNQFLLVASPTTQSNFFVKCTELGCSSNIGFSS
jgi:hypothetical protein